MDTGFLNPGTIASQQSLGGNDGTVDWINPSNVGSSNDSYAEVTLPTSVTDFSYHLKCTNFGFSVPGDKKIDGVEVQIEAHVLAGNEWGQATKTLLLVKGGTAQGIDKGGTDGGWDSSDSVSNFGGSSDKFGLSLTPADVNSSDFGVIFSVVSGYDSDIISIDNVRIKIHYSDNTVPTQNSILFGNNF